MKTKFLWLVGFAVMWGVVQARAGEQKPVTAAGLFIEGCSCKGICMGAINGSDPGCAALAVVELNGGQYRGVDMTGVKIAVAWLKDKRARVYLDVPKPNQHEAAKAFGSAYAGEFGKVDAVKDAPISITGQDGKFTVKVAAGKILEMTTEPDLGGDKHSPLMLSNVYDPLNSSFYHAKVVDAKYSDGDGSITLKDSNSFYNSRMRTSYGSK